MRSFDTTPRMHRASVAIAAGALCTLGTLAIALQVQVVGGHALDANLQVDGSGFNTVTARNRAPGLQSQAYRPSPAVSGTHPGLSSSVYRPGRGSSGSVDTRLSGAQAFTFTTGAGSISGFVDPRTGRAVTGRADPLRVPSYSALQTPTMVQRGTIPGAPPAVRVNRNTGAMMPTGMYPSQALSGVRYAAVRRGR